MTCTAMFRSGARTGYAPYERLQVVSDPTGAAQGKCRVLRGGAFYLQPRSVRAANRVVIAPVNRFYFYGFRLARTIPLSP